MMTRKRLLAGVILLLTATVSCNKKESYGLDPNNPITLTLWNAFQSSARTAFEDLVDEFNQTEGAKKGIFVVSRNFSSLEKLTTTLKTSISQQKETPDLCQATIDTAFYANQQKLLVNLSKYCSKQELNDYIDCFIDEGYLLDQSELKLFPIMKNGEALVVNMSAFNRFAEENPQYDTSYFSTYEDLAELSEAYYQWSGHAFFGCSGFDNYIFSGFKQFGIDFISAQAQTINIDKVVLKKLWDFYYTPYIKGYYLEQEATRIEDLRKENIIAYVDSTATASLIPATIQDEGIEIGVFPTPHFAEKEPIQIQSGENMMVLKSSRVKEYASVTFLKWLTAEENNLAFALSCGSLPVKKSSLDIKKIDSLIQSGTITLSEEVYKVVEQLIEQLQKQESFYVPYPSLLSIEIKTILKTSMPNLAKTNRAIILASSDQEATLAQYLDDQNFEDWYQSFQTALGI